MSSFLTSIGGGIEQNHQAYEALSSQAQALLEEALELVTRSDPKGTEHERVKEIFSSDTTLNANIQFPQIYGETLLSNAVTSSTLAMVKVLLEAGADPNVGNMMDGETPLDALLEDDEDERSPEQEEMLRLLQANGAEKSPSLEEQIQVVVDQRHRDLLWASGIDPDGPDATPGQDNILRTIFLKHALEAASQLDNETLQYKVEHNKRLIAARKIYKTLPEDSQELMKEAFHLLQINDDTDEPNYDSPSQAVKRIKEIFSLGAEGVSPNVLSYEDGESLLFLVVAHDRLTEDGEINKEQYALDLVKFLLQAGADPNLEPVTDRETALDFIDFNVPLSEMTAETEEIEKLLKEAGAKIRPMNDVGEALGERGEGEGFLDKARREANKRKSG